MTQSSLTSYTGAKSSAHSISSNLGARGDKVGLIRSFKVLVLNANLKLLKFSEAMLISLLQSAFC